MPTRVPIQSGGKRVSWCHSAWGTQRILTPALPNTPKGSSPTLKRPFTAASLLAINVLMTFGDTTASLVTTETHKLTQLTLRFVTLYGSVLEIHKERSSDHITCGGTKKIYMCWQLGSKPYNKGSKCHRFPPVDLSLYTTCFYTVVIPSERFCQNCRAIKCMAL